MIRAAADRMSPEEMRAFVMAARNEFVKDAATQWRFEHARLTAIRDVAIAHEKAANAETEAAQAALCRAQEKTQGRRDRAWARLLLAKQRLKLAAAAANRANDAVMAHYDADREIA